MIKLYKIESQVQKGLVFFEQNESEVCDNDIFTEGYFLTQSELEQREREAFASGRARRFVVRTETVNADNASTVQTSSPETFDDYLKQRKES